MDRSAAGDCPVQYIRGLPYPDLKCFIKQNIEDTMDYMPEDRDIIVSGYPKTGTHWMQYIVLQILSRGEKFPTIDNMIRKEIPFAEMFGTKVLESMPKPRVYKISSPYKMIQKNIKAKYVYMYRNPADTVVSYHPFMQAIIPEINMDFDKFFENFLSGCIGFGNYFDHVLSFYRYKDRGNILMVSYEKLLANRKEEILRIAKFLGESYYQSLLVDETILEKIIEMTSFDYMKKNLFKTNPANNEGNDKDKSTLKFFRKGVVGDGKNRLTDTQQQKLRDTVRNLMKGTEIAEEWLVN